MLTKRNLSVVSLERREVFTRKPGVEGFDVHDAPIRFDDLAGDESVYWFGLGPDTSTLQNCADSPAARERLMALFAAGEVNFGQAWINSLTSMTEGESCSI